MKENKEKITEEELSNINSKLEAVKELLTKSDLTLDELNSKVEELNNSFHPVASKIYAQATPDMPEQQTATETAETTTSN